MLNAIIIFSLRYRFLVLAIALAFAVAGAISVRELPIDAFPDTTPVQVVINTVAPGYAPEEVERQITFPVEQSISGLPRLQVLRSLSKYGLSQVVVVFDDGTDIYFARQLINERINSVKLPDGIASPTLGPVATGLGEVFHYTLRSNTRDLRELRTIQDWVLKPALRTVPGTAEINSWGGMEKQYQVLVDLDHLQHLDLTFDQVLQALRNNNANASGGNFRSSGEAYLVQSLGRVTDVDQIGRIPVASMRRATSIQVGDLGEVKVGHAIRTGGVTSQGRGEVILGLGFMLMGENSHAYTHRLKAKLEQIRPNLPKDVQVDVVYDRTHLVDQVIDTVRKNLFEGGILVIAVLFIFLGNLRAGLLVALAIPFSMLFAFTGMLRFGIAGSLLSLGAIDFGLVVDSSVVMIENVVRRLAHEKDDNRSKLDIVREAAQEVRGPTMFGELIIMVVYLPILTLEGVEGKMFRPMALTVIFALFGSMVLSLTVMPALASLLLPRKMDERDPLIVRLVRWFYAPILRLALHHSVAVLGLAAALLGIGIMLARSLGSEFVPKLSEGAFVLNIIRPTGTDLYETLRGNQRMEQLLLKEFPDEIAYVWGRTGTAEVATDPMGTEETDFFITLQPREKWTKVAKLKDKKTGEVKELKITTQDELREAIRALYEDLPGQNVSYLQPIGQRVDEMTSGVKSAIAVKIFGDDFDILKTKAEEVEAALKTIPGAIEIKTEQLSGQPLLQIRIKQEQLSRYGLSARPVLDLVEAMVGKPVGQLVEGQIPFPLTLRLPAELRRDVEGVRSILVTSPTGARVPLSQIADIDLVTGPAKVNREWSQRYITVQCNVDERKTSIGEFVAEARAKVAKTVKLPTERYRIEWGGQFENLDRARARLVLVVPIALCLIFFLLYVTYGRLSDVLLVFSAVPFASVGGILALWLRGLPFSISAGVGFIALSGVSVLNSMLLVSFIRHLRQAGVPFEESITEAALTRLRPVLMTALVASLGFVPMAMSTGVGAEVQRPLAIVVIGGVISSTLLTLLVLPVLYRYFGSKSPT